jgi:hypothetical protein
VVIGRELVATMMRRIGIEAIYRKPGTSQAALGVFAHQEAQFSTGDLQRNAQSVSCNTSRKAGEV